MCIRDSGDTYYILEDGEYRYSPRGDAGRTPWTFNLDVSAAYMFTYEEVEMRATINVFNVFNSQDVTSPNEHYEVEEGTYNQYYDAAYSWQAPRSVRLSFEARY